MFKKTFLLALISFVAMAASAQHKFDPVKFEKHLEEFVVKDAKLTAAEQNKFLPLFREKRKKEVALLAKVRQDRKGRPSTEKEIERAIKDRDATDIELKKIQQSFHNHLLRILPASKVQDVIRSEEKFHRQQFNKMAERRNGKPGDNGNSRGRQPGAKPGDGSRPMKKGHR